MREYVFLGCAIAIAACGGAKGGSRVDSARLDTSAASPARTVPAESLRSSPGATEAATTDARTSPASRSASATTTPTGVKPIPPAAGADTVRGIVSVVGTSRDQHVMIAPTGGGKRVEVTGAPAALIGHTAGADVWVTGTRTGNSIEAARFVVRTVDGAAAVDGTLKSEASALYIVTSDGTRTRITAPPPPLLGHEGARVWVTGDLSKGVSSFGFIDPPR
jgi:hypothetical protein